jgi:hypothetical protein
MNKFLTRAEIDKKFDSEWVLLADPKTDKHNNVKGGIVIRHSRSREEVYQKIAEDEHKEFAVLYVGKLPKGTVFVL